MAVTFAGRRVEAAPRGAAHRFLEDERRLAMVLLLPSIALLGLFIAYPFAKGVWRSVTVARSSCWCASARHRRRWQRSVAASPPRTNAVSSSVRTGGPRRGGRPPTPDAPQQPRNPNAPPPRNGPATPARSPVADGASAHDAEPALRHLAGRG